MRNNYRHPDTIVLNLVLNLVSVTHTKFSRVSCFQETLQLCTLTHDEETFFYSVLRYSVLNLVRSSGHTHAHTLREDA